MDIYGLIGKPLKHSFSGDYFAQKFEKKHIDAEYRLWELDDIPDLHSFAREHPQLRGLNITIPYKRTVVPALDELDAPAQIIGSVNVVKVNRKGGEILLRGYNTDVIGFERSLKPLVKGRKQLRALILGTGGSAHSVAFVLRRLGIYFYYITRRPKKLEMLGYSWITPAIMNEFQLIVNTSPVGMYPDTEHAPVIPYEMLTPGHILFDLIYNPEETLFLKKGKAQGAIVKNGLEMLKIQAEESWKIWKKH
ncbi:MAG: shikimate 5-dehydrogenase [bacterium]|nr:MAG: shikimate 5-dehydrogenase [bacterium]